MAEKVDSKSKLTKVIERIHLDCHKLCQQALNKYLPVAGNVGIFCHSDSEQDALNKISKDLTYPSGNPDQKYFQLKGPIAIRSGRTPLAVYTHLYIRRPDPSEYGRYLGDIDFVTDTIEYQKLKQLTEADLIQGAEVYDRLGWDTIQITDPNIRSVAYVSTKEFAKKVRIKF